MSLLALAALPALGQDAGATDDQTAPAARHFVMQPRISVQETLSDNVNLSQKREAGVISAVSPGVHIASEGARVSGTLDYSLTGIVYSGGQRPTQIQNSLTARGNAVLVEHLLFVDASAGITHQSASAVGPLTTSSYSGTNVQEIGTASISPYLRNRLGDFAQLELRDTATYTNARHSVVGDSHGNLAAARLDGLNAGQLTWWASISSQRTHFRASDVEATDNQWLLGLQWRPDIDFKSTVFGGRERNNYLLGSEADSTTYGATGLWTPNERTRLELDWQRHSYGASHTVALDYRLMRSALRASDVSAVNLGQPQNNSVVATNYDLLYLEFASIVPDPVQRDALVRAYLSTLGIDPNGQVVAAFATSGPTHLHTQQLAYSIEGLRTNWIASLTQGHTEQLGSNALPVGFGNFSSVRTRGGSLTASHKLTPTESANLSLSYQQNLGMAISGTEVQSNLRTLLATWSSRPGPMSTLTVSLRHAQGGGTGAYTENAVIGTFVQNF